METNQYSKYDSMALNDLIRAMDMLERKRDAVKDELAEINKEYDVLRMSIIPKKMEDEGVHNTTLAGVGRVQLTDDLFASIKAGMKDEAYQWLSDNGHGDLISPTVNASSLKAMIKQAIVKGEDIPEDYFNISPVVRASITRKGVTGD